MNTFNLGDRVRVIMPAGLCRYSNVEGTIAEVRAHNYHPYRIEGMDPWWFSESEIAK